MERYIKGCAVQYPDDTRCTEWAILSAGLKRLARQISQHDAWIAVAALHLNVPLVTHNAAHFRGILGLTLLTEPDPPALRRP